MKSYHVRSKYFSSLISFIIIFHIYSMDESLPVGQHAHTVCPFFKLPVEIQDLIAHSLSFDDIESEDEFVERTKVMKNERTFAEYNKHYYQHFAKHLPGFLYGIGYGDMKGEYCSNRRKIAYLRSFDGRMFINKIITATLVVVDIAQNQKQYEKSLDNHNYLHCALSRNADMFATLHKKYVASGDGHLKFRFGENVLRIQRAVTDTMEEVEISDHFNTPDYDKYAAIAFNKQGTHIIVHGVDFIQALMESGMETVWDVIKQNPIQHHRIIPLTINTAGTSPEKKTLQHYFEQKLVCKKITQ